MKEVTLKKMRNMCNSLLYLKNKIIFCVFWIKLKEKNVFWSVKEDKFPKESFNEDKTTWILMGYRRRKLKLKWFIERQRFIILLFYY